MWPSPVTKNPLPVPTAAATGHARAANSGKQNAGSARITEKLVVRPASAGSGVLDIFGDLVRVVQRFFELVELPQQRLQAYLGGRIAVALAGQFLDDAGRALEIAPALDRPRACRGFSTCWLVHGARQNASLVTRPSTPGQTVNTCGFGMLSSFCRKRLASSGVRKYIGC